MNFLMYLVCFQILETVDPVAPVTPVTPADPVTPVDPLLTNNVKSGDVPGNPKGATVSTT